MGKIITITSRKGGVGKTTTLLNLAGCFSDLQKKVLILDLDLYSSSIAISLNLRQERTIFNLVDDITNNRFTELNDYVVKYNQYIDVLKSVKDPRQASRINLKYIEQIINMFKHYYDVVLIDTSHVLTDLNIVIYDNSNTILNIMSNDPVDLVNTKTFVNIVSDIGFKDFRVLLNESNSLEEKYFSVYDIRSFINHNIDYHLGHEFYVKTIDKYVLDGKILTLVGNVFPHDKKEYKKIMKVASDLLEDIE